MGLLDKVKKFVDNQYGAPKGLMGTYIGEKMVRQHIPETVWTIELLNIQKSESVLELGCGSGYAMKLILEQNLVGKVVGLDLSPTVIRSAMIRNKQAINEEKANLVQANVKSLPFENEQFDKVFSIHSIYFWDELSVTISEIYRVLKSGGGLILTLCDGKNSETWDGISSLIDEQIIPMMKNKGMLEVSLVRGPNSRQFHTVAVTGRKEL
jgi:ubiquinone/menaquinone biosynthesis C-methylase UbiE